MFSSEKENIKPELLISSVAHDLKTPLMAINSSLSCARDAFPILIKSFELSSYNGLISEELTVPFLRKIENSLGNSIKEIKLINYYIERLEDTLSNNYPVVNIQDSVLLYDVIKEVVDFCGLIYKNCHEKIILDEELKDIKLITDKKVIKKALTYFIDNMLLLSAKNEHTVIRILVDRKIDDIICTFLLNEIDIKLMDKKSLYDRLSSGSKLGQGIYYFEEFVKLSGWIMKELITESEIKIDLLFKS